MLSIDENRFQTIQIVGSSSGKPGSEEASQCRGTKDRPLEDRPVDELPLSEGGHRR